MISQWKYLFLMQTKVEGRTIVAGMELLSVSNHLSGMFAEIYAYIR